MKSSVLSIHCGTLHFGCTEIIYENTTMFCLVNTEQLVCFSLLLLISNYKQTPLKCPSQLFLIKITKFYSHHPLSNSSSPPLPRLCPLFPSLLPLVTTKLSQGMMSSMRRSLWVRLMCPPWLLLTLSLAMFFSTPWGLRDALVPKVPAGKP